MKRLTYVFRDAVDLASDEFFENVDHAITQLNAEGFGFELESDEALFTNIHELIYSDSEDRACVSFIGEPDKDLSYLVVTAGRQSDANYVVGVLERFLAFADLEEIQDQAERNLLFKPHWLVKLALAQNGRPEPRSLELVRRGLKHRGTKGRYLAVVAAAHARWFELSEDLETLLKGEPDETVRKMAKRALSFCKRSGGA